jgi:hypothetical protein
MDIRAAIDASIVFTEDELYNLKYMELKKLVKSSEDIPDVCARFSYPLERFMYYENMQHYTHITQRKKHLKKHLTIS